MYATRDIPDVNFLTPDTQLILEIAYRLPGSIAGEQCIA